MVEADVNNPDSYEKRKGLWKGRNRCRDGIGDFSAKVPLQLGFITTSPRLQHEQLQNTTVATTQLQLYLYRESIDADDPKLAS